jgi:hypothetical protein
LLEVQPTRNPLAETPSGRESLTPPLTFDVGSDHWVGEGQIDPDRKLPDIAGVFVPRGKLS